MVFLLLGGIIKEDFLVDQSSVEGSQTKPAVVVAPNGNFAVAWEDSLGTIPSLVYTNIYIRFFDKDGNPLTDAFKLNVDSFSNNPSLSVDDSGRVVCAWLEGSENFSRNLYARLFDQTGTPSGERITVTTDIEKVPFCVGSNPSGGFLIAWVWDAFWGQRYDASGTPVGEQVGIYPHEIKAGMILLHPTTALNRYGSTVISWWYFNKNPENYMKTICFQILDSANNLAFPDTFAHVTDDIWWSGMRQVLPRTRWVNEERFVIFWSKELDYTELDSLQGFQGKLFNMQGDSISRIKTYLDNDTNIYWTNWDRPLEVSTCRNGKFAFAYARSFRKPEPYGRYERVVGFLLDTSLTRTTGIFRLPPDDPHYDINEEQPSVDASGDCVVWVWTDYSEMRKRPDSYYYSDVHCKITDWDLLGVQEPPSTSLPDFEISNPIGREIVVRFWDRPEGFRASVFDVSGRKVDELKSPNQNGILIWGPHQNPGVYFIVPTSGKAQASKVILIK